MTALYLQARHGSAWPHQKEFVLSKLELDKESPDNFKVDPVRDGYVTFDESFDEPKEIVVDELDSEIWEGFNDVVE